LCTPRAYLPSFPTRRSSDLGDAAVLAQFDNAVRHREMLERADHCDQVAARAVLLIQVAEIKVKQRVAVGEEKRRIDLALEQAERSEEHTSELQSRFDLVCRL